MIRRYQIAIVVLPSLSPFMMYLMLLIVPSIQMSYYGLAVSVIAALVAAAVPYIWMKNRIWTKKLETLVQILIVGFLFAIFLVIFNTITSPLFASVWYPELRPWLDSIWLPFLLALAALAWVLMRMMAKTGAFERSLSPFPLILPLAWALGFVYSLFVYPPIMEGTSAMTNGTLTYVHIAFHEIAIPLTMAFILLCYAYLRRAR